MHEPYKKSVSHQHIRNASVLLFFTVNIYWSENNFELEYFYVFKNQMRAERCGFRFLPWEIKLLSNIFIWIWAIVWQLRFFFSLCGCFFSVMRRKYSLNGLVYVWTGDYRCFVLRFFSIRNSEKRNTTSARGWKHNNNNTCMDIYSFKRFHHGNKFSEIQLTNVPAET